MDKPLPVLGYYEVRAPRIWFTVWSHRNPDYEKAIRERLAEELPFMAEFPDSNDTLVERLTAMVGRFVGRVIAVDANTATLRLEKDTRAELLAFATNAVIAFEGVSSGTGNETTYHVIKAVLYPKSE